MRKKRNNLTCDFLLKTSFKLNFTLFMSLLAFILYAINPTKARELCLFAVAISTLGDLALMNYKGLPSLIFKGKQFYAGMFFFAIAHFLYCLCFSLALNFSFFNNFNDGSFLVLALWVLMVHVMCIINYHSNTLFKVATHIYSVCILSSMVAIATVAYRFGGKYIFAWIGIIMFFVSDFLILVREKVRDNETIKKSIWILYPLGQLLIIFSV